MQEVDGTSPQLSAPRTVHRMSSKPRQQRHRAEGSIYMRCTPRPDQPAAASWLRDKTRLAVVPPGLAVLSGEKKIKLFILTAIPSQMELGLVNGSPPAVRHLQRFRTKQTACPVVCNV